MIHLRVTMFIIGVLSMALLNVKFLGMVKVFVVQNVKRRKTDVRSLSYGVRQVF